MKVNKRVLKIVFFAIFLLFSIIIIMAGAKMSFLIFEMRKSLNNYYIQSDLLVEQANIFQKNDWNIYPGIKDLNRLTGNTYKSIVENRFNFKKEELIRYLEHLKKIDISLDKIYKESKNNRTDYNEKNELIHQYLTTIKLYQEKRSFYRNEYNELLKDYNIKSKKFIFSMLQKFYFETDFIFPNISL